ncbi:uncharacterized protein LOC125179319 [Hyalella azteca]|uniref:Thyrotropin-releasing hormone receptor n=1 Tax=Hyalella azteca TaxID=294128 RepID=A0A979FXM3_HYAAZ|nr:uncharacterized protein LOC125179319 [Hyalella azteca]
MVLVWAFSALYSCPRLLYFEVAEYPVEGGKEAMCILRRDLFDTKIWDVVSLILLFLLPLLLLTILYLRIAHVLCASSKLLAQVSYSETGKFIRTSPRPSASETGRGCFCSTKQEFLSTISVTNGKRGSQGNSNVENCPAFSPALLNAVNNTAPAKSKRFQGFKLAKRWKKSTSKQLEHHQNKLCSFCEEKNFHVQNRHNPCTADACIQKVIIQENSASYSSVTETDMSHHRKSEHIHCHTTAQIPSYIEDNFHKLEIPINDEISHCSLQEEIFLDSPLAAGVLKPRSQQSIPSAFESRCARTAQTDQRMRKMIPSDRLSVRGHCDHLDENEFRAQHLHNEMQDRVNSYGSNASRQREQLRRTAVVMRPSPVVLKARRKVVHMLVLVVVSFAIFSLPFHARKMMQYFLPSYNHTSNFSMLFTPVTCLIMFAHSAVNPILYTCLSRKFRASLRDLFKCRLTRRSSAGVPRQLCNSKPLLARLNSDGRVSLQLH